MVIYILMSILTVVTTDLCESLQRKILRKKPAGWVPILSKINLLSKIKLLRENWSTGTNVVDSVNECFRAIRLLNARYIAQKI